MPSALSTVERQKVYGEHPKGQQCRTPKDCPLCKIGWTFDRFSGRWRPGDRAYWVRTAGNVVEVGSAWKDGTDSVPWRSNGEAVRIEGKLTGTAKTQARSTVKCFSRKSRSRLFRTCAAINWNLLGPGFFVTLTYPGDLAGVDQTGAGTQAHLKAFWKRLERQYGEVGGMWKREFQARGAVHFHIAMIIPVLGGEENDGLELVRLRDFVAGAWYEVVGSGQATHLLAGTQVQELADHPAAYFAGYAGGSHSSKEYQHRVPDGMDDVGRFWGVRRLRPEWAERRISEDQAVELRRVMRSYRKSRRRSKAQRDRGRRYTGWMALAGASSTVWLSKWSSVVLGEVLIGRPPDRPSAASRNATVERHLLVAVRSAAASSSC